MMRNNKAEAIEAGGAYMVAEKINGGGKNESNGQIERNQTSAAAATAEEIDVFSDLKNALQETREDSDVRVSAENNRRHDSNQDVDEENQLFTESEEDSFRRREKLSARLENDDNAESAGDSTLTRTESAGQGVAPREGRGFRGSIKRVLKPDGHYNKPVIAGFVFLGLFLLFVLLPGGGGSGNDELADKAATNAEKLPDSSSELSTVTPGNFSAGNSNGNLSEETILGLGNTNSAVNSNLSPAAANTNQLAQTPVTTTQTYTTYEKQTVSPEDANTNPQTPTKSVSTTGLNPQQKQISDGFTVDFGNEDSKVANQTVTTNRQPEQIESDVPVKQLRVMPGTKVQMVLSEPFRSGIETKVQAVCLNNIKGVDNKTIIPANSVFEIVFRPEEIGGRVLAKPVVRVFLADGTIGEVAGIVKGMDGFAGLTGKIIKQGGGGSLGGKILGGIGRVVGSRLPGGVGAEVENEIEERNGSNVSRSTRIVEISQGTRFYFHIGTPE